MALELLERTRHSGLRIDIGNAGERHFVQLVADEFLPASLDYPILFTKHPQSGAFYPGAVMGLEAGRNLLTQEGRLSGYRPADLVRQGVFLTADGIAVDPEDPVWSPAGDPLFDPQGEATAALKRVQAAMHMLKTGLPETEAFIARLLANQLVEPIDIALDFDDGGRLRLDGLYSISLDRLHALSDAAALALFRQGDLQLIYAQTNSVRHIRRLAAIRNARLLEGQ